MKKKYRPAGNSIVLKNAPVPENLFHPFTYRLFQSGTASLASAIAACVNLKKLQAGKTEIILPAYACPDLVSAVLNVGAKPVLVDLEENSPWLSCEQVVKHVTPHTIAIIAINFMGLAGNIIQLKELCKDNDIYLIYDSAQWFPLDIGYDWPGDFNIVSFGRGKPINLLHGGAVILREPEYELALVDPPAPEPNIRYKIKQFMRIKIYNFVIEPRIYRFVSHLPGLNIGQTLFEPLETISVMNSFYTDMIEPNIDKFRAQTNALQYLHKKITGISHPLLLNLVTEELGSGPAYLLRYPLLIKHKKTRDQFYEQTRDYGTSLLYRQPLNRIRGLENILDQVIVYRNANNFADHLVTLPCHEDINNTIVDVIVDKLQSVLNNDL